MNSKQNKDPGAGRGTFLAIGLCVVFYLAWNQYLTKKYPGHNQPKDTAAQQVESSNAQHGVIESPSPNTATSAAPAAAGPAAAVAAEFSPKAPAMSPQDLVVETPDLQFMFSQDLASPTSIVVRSYRETNDLESKPIELLKRPLVVQGLATAEPQARTKLVDHAGKRDGRVLTFTRQEGPWQIVQQWTLPESGYAAKLGITWTNTSAEPQVLKSTTLFEMGAVIDTTKHSFFAPGAPNEEPRFLTQFDGSDDFKNIADFCKDQTVEVAGKNKKLDFFGFDTHYFAAAFVPQAAADYRTAYLGHPNGICEIMTSVTSDLGTIAPGQSTTLSWDAWFGPKEVELLTAFNPHLKTTLGLGWLDMIAYPLLLAIKGLHKFLGNYGLAIIALTLLLKILFYPLSKQAAVSAAKMKKLNPEMTKLREKYKSDQQKMQMELMKFMSVNKINPMKGCLPILPQIPVFFALFRVLSASIDLRHAPFYFWITDLSAKDPYFVTPIILTGCMFVQQKLTPMTGMDKTQEKIMMMMPLIFGVMMISLPSGLVLYMLTNTIVSIAQQQYLNKKLA